MVPSSSVRQRRLLIFIIDFINILYTVFDTLNLLCKIRDIFGNFILLLDTDDHVVPSSSSSLARTGLGLDDHGVVVLWRLVLQEELGVAGRGLGEAPAGRALAAARCSGVDCRGGHCSSCGQPGVGQQRRAPRRARALRVAARRQRRRAQALICNGRERLARNTEIMVEYGHRIGCKLLVSDNAELYS